MKINELKYEEKKIDIIFMMQWKWLVLQNLWVFYDEFEYWIVAVRNEY